ncbi:MAG: Rpn family recombination-promoting nuclease/putative transposase [Sodalis sp. (in: enterobacteria)]|uniref:Rpn family recombination-promoting nuclease/putative transposase n=1 Tax=Sodalis sp. (in: enterobacteria) TaxID=1898979 RepID=UPI0039E3D62F
MSKKFTPTPHDAVFRQFLHDKATAQDFFDIWLPDDIKALCDWATLKPESGSFIDPDMKPYQSDILYSVNANGADGYVYCLIEHQSTPDKLMAWRLMRYCMAAMQRHLEAGHDKLPLVFPVLFYCGEKSPHPYSTNWLDCFERPDIAAKIYSQPFRLADVTTLDDDAIMQHRRMALLELIQKHIRRRDMTELLDSIVKLLSYNYYTDTQVVTMMNYLVQEGNAASPRTFITEIARRAEKHEEALMTIAEALKQEGKQEGYQIGREEGIQQGMQQGMQQGEHTAAMKIARQLVSNGVDRAIVKISTGLSDHELDNLIQ